ncbi:MAG: SAM-dependent chlorinase/fluorinase [Candidatus Bathyarchaeota archaeon]|nr:MAG: SAM-dependent chlorinase/fluorinase [Candidatus Bathyarchaeota archaeon]
MRQVIITLLSDFGLKDSYVAEMKGTILCVLPKAKIIDISHDIDKFDIRMGAFVLASAIPYFPQNTVHVAVVDPGVGTERRPIILKTKNCYLVGPDNGVLMLAAINQGLKHVYVIENPEFMLQRVSKTFHGRDVFAPAAAHLARGISIAEFGREIRDYVVPDFAQPHLEGSVACGEILHIDNFGNIISNIPSALLEKVGIKEKIHVKIGAKAKSIKLHAAYDYAPLGETIAIFGSHDFLEISINQGAASKQFNGKRGDSIRVWPTY